MKISEQCFAKNRPGKNGGTFTSGWMMLSQLEHLINTAKNAGLDAVGMNPVTRKTAKFDGTVIEITPFKLSAKATA